MGTERVAPWSEEPDRSVQLVSREFPRVVGFRRRRDGDVGSPGRPPTRPLVDDQGNGALPQADCAWARCVWLPRVMRAPWMTWAQAVRDTFIGQIP